MDLLRVPSCSVCASGLTAAGGLDGEAEEGMGDPAIGII